MVTTANFDFLRAHDPTLVRLGGLAERYFRDDPATALVKLRQFIELLSKLIAAHHAVYIGERETFEETLRRLSYDRILPREVADVFHHLRKLGNAATHEVKGTHADALSGLKFARQLGVWFHRTYAKQLGFKPGPFAPPPEPVDATLTLKDEIAALRQKLSDTESAAEKAKAQAEAEARTRETLEDRLNRETQERAL